MDELNKQLQNQAYFNKVVQLSPFNKQLKDTKTKAIILMLLLYSMVIILGLNQSWFVFGIVLISFFAGLVYMGIKRMERMYRLYHATSLKELYELYSLKPQSVITIQPLELSEVYDLRVQVRGDVINQQGQDQLQQDVSNIINDEEFRSLLLALPKTRNVRVIKLKEEAIYRYASDKGIDQGRWYFDVLPKAANAYQAIPIEKLGVSVLYYMNQDN